MYGMHLVVEHATAVEFAQEGGDAAGAVDVFHVVIVVVRRYLRQGWDLGSDAPDVSEREVDLPFPGNSENVEHGIG